MNAARQVVTLAAAVALSVAACNKQKQAIMPGPLVGAVEGSVRDTSGAALDQASVRLRRPGAAETLRAALTDATGRYLFTGVEPGRYDVFLIVPAATALAGANPRSVSVTELKVTDADFTLTLEPVSYAHHVVPVLNGACTGCHSTAGGAPLGLRLTDRRARGATVRVASAEQPDLALIQPGQPDSSYLVHKIQGSHATVGGGGGQMPQGFPPLPHQTIRMIRRWVAQGALQN